MDAHRRSQGRGMNRRPRIFLHQMRIVRREDTDRVMDSTDNSNNSSSTLYNTEIAKDIVMAVY